MNASEIYTRTLETDTVLQTFYGMYKFESAQTFLIILQTCTCKARMSK